jgi:cobalt/nickel transport system permease protein
MHMADALLSTGVGGTMWAATAGTIAYSSKQVRRALDDGKTSLMAVLGAFLFAAQMINFTIPATGSSGHIAGGLLLSILLGPAAAYLTIASVLVVQAFFFADGGLLALGCNIFNMGFLPAFIVYPLIYKKILGTCPDRPRLTAAIMISAIAGLQLGSFSVVVETWASGISAVPFSRFILLMQPIHLAIGCIEGVVSLAVVSFLFKARPDIFQAASEPRPVAVRPIRGIIVSLCAGAVIMGGGVSLVASNNPDGLEWALARVTGKSTLKGSDHWLNGALASLQTQTAFLPDYSFRKPAVTASDGAQGHQGMESSVGSGIAGIIGVLMTMIFGYLGCLILKKRTQTG